MVSNGTERREAGILEASLICSITLPSLTEMGVFVTLDIAATTQKVTIFGISIILEGNASIISDPHYPVKKKFVTHTLDPTSFIGHRQIVIRRHLGEPLSAGQSIR